MKKSIALIAIFAMIISVFGVLFTPNSTVQAKGDFAPGTVFKAKGHSAVYYLGDDGKRYVFPNKHTYLSWYEDFSNVAEVEDLSEYSLGGNVRYKPGVLLVKIQSDPKVYVVGVNGLLRWIKTEALATALYGENWNLLVDDIPVGFFINYAIGDPVDDETDFDADEEEEGTESINENRKAKIQAKIYKKIAKRKAKLCRNLEKRLNKIQKRLERRGITVTGVGDNFVSICVENGDDDNNESGTVVGNKAKICHMPPGNPDNAKTITVGSPSARAHLSHGDTLGECGDQNGGGDDTTPSVISAIAATPQATSTTITWTTDEDSTSVVEYADESLATASTTTEVIDETLVTSHSVELTGLATSTQYFFTVESKDASDNIATSTEMTFTTLAAEVADITPPVISAIVATPQATSTTITWTTDEDSTSVVEYADESLATATTTDNITDNALVTAHSVELTGLATSTQYFFTVESKDASDNIATSSEETFTTSS